MVNCGLISRQVENVLRLFELAKPERNCRCCDRLASILLGNIGDGGNPRGTPFSLILKNVPSADLLTATAIMTGGANSGRNPRSAFLDNFSLTRVPEQATAVLLGICLCGMMGMDGRRGHSFRFFSKARDTTVVSP